MRRKMLALLIANLLAAPAFAQDTGITGSVSVGGISVDDKDAVDASKLNEYREMEDGLLTQFDIRGRGARYWFDAYGENLGREAKWLARVNEGIRALASRDRVVLADIHARFLGHGLSAPENERWYWSELIFEPNAEGARQVAALWRELLVERS